MLYDYILISGNCIIVNRINLYYYKQFQGKSDSKTPQTCCLFLAYFLYYLWQQESANIFTVLECSNKFLFWLIKLWCFFNHKNWKRQQIIAIIRYFVGFAKTLYKYKRNNFLISKFCRRRISFTKLRVSIVCNYAIGILLYFLLTPDTASRQHVVITTTREAFRRGLELLKTTQ